MVLPLASVAVARLDLPRKMVGVPPGQLHIITKCDVSFRRSIIHYSKVEFIPERSYVEHLEMFDLIADL